MALYRARRISAQHLQHQVTVLWIPTEASVPLLESSREMGATVSTLNKLEERLVKALNLSPKKYQVAPSGQPLAEPLLDGPGAGAVGTPMSGGIFVLANTILGAGMLGLPFAFAACGFLVGPIMLLAFALCSATALVMLSEAADMAGRPANFRSVSEMAVPGAGLYIDIAVAIKCFGVATSYLIVIGDSVPKAIVAFGASGILLDRRLWTLAALCIAGPLAYMKQITALRHVSKVRAHHRDGMAFLWLLDGF